MLNWTAILRTDDILPHRLLALFPVHPSSRLSKVNMLYVTQPLG